jgi:carbonic anhydrase/acetyltransferase-like protein (isoleucine patch superfamily)
MSVVYEFKGISPKLPENDEFWIAPGSYVIGNVILAEGTSVWFGVTIRGDNESVDINTNSNIQENSVLHTDLGFPIKIGKNCTIGHKAMLHGCSVDDNSLIGMGATLLNGSHIKKNCLVGANSLITEGKSFPENSLIMGSPAKVVRELREDEIEGIRKSAVWYRENMARFKYSLKAIKLE